LDQLFISIQNEDMRVSVNLGILRQESSIQIFSAHVDLHQHIVLVSECRQIRMFMEEIIHNVAPAAPLATHDHKDIAV
jgi:hypothetical protein